MPVFAVAKFERFFRAAAELDVDRNDLKRYSDFVERKLYDLLLIGQATAGANARDIIEPWDLPIAKGLQESMHAFRKLDEEIELKPIGLGTAEEFTGLFGQIVRANTAFSEQDREDVAWFVPAYGDRIEALLPETIPQKENAAYLAGQLLAHLRRERAVEIVAGFTRTATDILRLAVALSAGDLSLAKVTRFRVYTRPERALLLGLLDRLPFAAVVEDMLRWKGRWIRLGERLHPGEYAKRYPNAARAFSVLRNDEPFTTFNASVEQALSRKDAAAALSRLVTRPGDLARRLDHLLRLDTQAQDTVIAAFAEVSERVSTPVLLQVRQHFVVRNATSALRVFFPKGNLAKAKGIENTLPALPDAVCTGIVAACEAALAARFATLPPLGRVYIDPALRDLMVPFALRSASKSLRTLVRGSRLSLPAGDVLRFFVWWKNGDERTDIDLSAVIFSADFEYVSDLSYYNLEGFGGAHSGDIVDAPEGASEFIDVTLAKLQEAGIRYVLMSLTSYTEQPFVELPECFAGWMARQEPESGEIFEPKTVQDRLDISADTKISLPLIVDVVAGQVIWCDMALRRDPTWVNNVVGNLSGMTMTLRSLVETRKPNLYDLFVLHARARGTLAETPEDADTVFSLANGTPFRLEEIASGYMA